MQEAAQVLGNTPAIARKSYVDPRIVDAFARGETVNATSGRAIESELLALLTG
jgi:DNA topoisomerase-1